MTRLLRLEWRLWRRDGSAWIVAVVLLAAGMYAASNGLAWSTFMRGAIETAESENRRQFEALKADATALVMSGRSPDIWHRAASPALVSLFTPRYAVLPALPLAFVSAGQSDVTPYYFQVTGERRDSFLDAEEIENPINLLHGPFDLAFVVTVFLPLLLLAVSFNAISADRESGVLALVGAQPTRLVALARARLGVRAGWAFGLCGVFVGGAFVMSGVDVGEARTSMALVTLAVALAVWIVLWLALGTAVSTLSRSSSTNAVLALASWLLLLVVAPTVLNVAAQARHPVPPRTALIEHTRALYADISPQIAQLLDEYYRRHPDAKPAGLDTSVYNFPLYWTAHQSEMERRMAPILANYDEALARQQAFVSRWAWAAPGLAFQELLNDLAGTSTSRYLRFLEQVSAFHAEHRAFFEPRTYSFQFLTPDDYDRMPQFRFEEEPTRAWARRIGLQALVLAGWAASVMVIARRRIARVTP